MWTDEEIAVLLNGRYKSIRELEKLLPLKTRSAIISKRSRLKAAPSKKTWSEKEISILVKLYGVVKIEEILEKLPDRTETAIRSKAATLRKGERSIGRYNNEKQ
jgi:hypothetical protein